MTGQRSDAADRTGPTDRRPGAAGVERLPEVAREAIRARLERRAADPPAVAPGGPLARTAPVFVTLWSDGALRGCVGALSPRHGDLVAETMDRAIAAAFEDPRFPPLTAGELPACSIDVTILDPLEPVTSAGELDPLRYGVVVSDAQGRSAVHLPAIEGIDTPDQQIELTRRKAGIPAGEPITICRFSVLKVEDRLGCR